MTLTFARVSLGKDLKVHTRNYTVSYKGEDVLLGKKKISRPPSAICPPPLPPASPYPLQTCSRMGGGRLEDKGSPTTPNNPLQKTRIIAGGVQRISWELWSRLLRPLPERADSWVPGSRQMACSAPPGPHAGHVR